MYLVQAPLFLVPAPKKAPSGVYDPKQWFRIPPIGRQAEQKRATLATSTHFLANIEVAWILLCIFGKKADKREEGSKSRKLCGRPLCMVPYTATYLC